MTCPRCGAENAEESKFCIKCGTPLQINPNPQVNVQPTTVEPTQTVAQTISNIEQAAVAQLEQQVQPTPVQPQVAPQMVAQAPVASNATLNFVKFIINMIIKPFKTFKEESTKLENIKNPIILAVILSVVMTLFKVATLLLSIVKITSKSKYYKFGEIAKEIGWFKVIGQSFLIYAGIILAIAVVFYIAGLIAKKSISFAKTLAISASALIPYIVCSMILSTLGGYIWSYLSLFFSAAGFILAFVVLYELMNEELKLESDTKIYFNVACILIIAIGGYFAMTKVLPKTEAAQASFVGSFSSILDMFD